MSDIKDIVRREVVETAEVLKEARTIIRQFLPRAAQKLQAVDNPLAGLELLERVASITATLSKSLVDAVKVMDKGTEDTQASSISLEELLK